MNKACKKMVVRVHMGFIEISLFRINLYIFITNISPKTLFFTHLWHNIQKDASRYLPVYHCHRAWYFRLKNATTKAPYVVPFGHCNTDHPYDSSSTINSFLFRVPLFVAPPTTPNSHFGLSRLQPAVVSVVSFVKEAHYHKQIYQATLDSFWEGSRRLHQ